MTTKKTEYKRHYPRIGQCVCCCCCTPDTSVKIATAILLIANALTILVSIKNYPILDQLSFDETVKIFNYVSLVMSIIVCISYILLLVGIDRINFFCLNQFKFVYLIYLLFCLASSIYTYTLIYNEDYRKQQIEIIKEEYSNSDLLKSYEFTTDELSDSIRRSATSTLAGCIVGILILAYYYLTTCSYIEDLEEKAVAENDVRDVENNEKVDDNKE